MNHIPSAREVLAQLEATTAEVGKLHEILLARIRHGDFHSHRLGVHVRSLLETELSLRLMASSIQLEDLK